MTITNKIKWVLGIFIVLMLIIATNLIDRDNFKSVKESVETMYHDRLVAKGILFDISNLLHQKEIAFLRADSVFFAKKNQLVNESLDDLISLFSKTQLTPEEEKNLDRLLLNYNKLKKIGVSFEEINSDKGEKWMNQLDKVKFYVVEISKIQIAEGEKQFFSSQKAFRVVELFTSIEIYVVISLAVIIQLLILYSPGKKNKSKAE